MGTIINLFKSLTLLSTIFLCLLASACGENLFSGFEPDIGNLSASLDQAQTADDYTAIAEAATVVIDSSTSTNEEKEDAYLARAESRLGQDGLGISICLKILSVLSTQVETP